MTGHSAEQREVRSPKALRLQEGSVLGKCEAGEKDLG